MRTRHALIVSLLCLVHAAFAQDWHVADPYAFNDETVVYATIQSNVPSDQMTDFAVAAFIDGECRVEAKSPVVGIDGSEFFILRVRGDQTTDLGKAITFRAYHKSLGETYDLTPAIEVNYTGESEGAPSRPIILGLEREDIEVIPLQGFFLDAYGLAVGRTLRVQLEPYPYDATFNPRGVELVFTGSIPGWTAMEVQHVPDEPLSFDLTPQYPGIVQIQVTMGGNPVPLYGMTGGPLTSVEASALIDLQEGWQWRSNPYGDILNWNIGNIFSNEQLVEARTQDGLVYNDPTWGYFGTILESGIAQNTCYKVKMRSTPMPTILQGGHYEPGYTIVLDGEWTWTGVPYYYDRPISEALNPERLALPEGMVIVSKEDGSAEFNGTEWRGDLTVLRSGQGVMVYSPLDEPFNLRFTPEATMPQGTPAPARAEQAATARWHYDASRFMNNTTIVAEVAGMPSLTDDWTLGVFVGNECRGEGHFVGGQFFITAHTDRGEQVRLVLRHEPTGTTTDIVETLTTGLMRIGSLRQPVMLHATDATVGVSDASHLVNSDGVNSDGVNSHSYDLTGRRVVHGKQGIVLRRMADGTVRKVLVK